MREKKTERERCERNYALCRACVGQPGR
jgi:hypothetical protein